MNNEIISLLKTFTGSTETLIIWYMVMNFAETLIGWIGAVVLAYMFGRGIRKNCEVLSQDDDSDDDNYSR